MGLFKSSIVKFNSKERVIISKCDSPDASKPVPGNKKRDSLGGVF